MGTLVCVIVQRCRGATLPGAPPRSDRTAHFRRRRLGSRPGSRRKATGDNAAGRAAPGATGQYAAANAAGRRGETRQGQGRRETPSVEPPRTKPSGAPPRRAVGERPGSAAADVAWSRREGPLGTTPPTEATESKRNTRRPHFVAPAACAVTGGACVRGRAHPESIARYSPSRANTRTDSIGNSTSWSSPLKPARREAPLVDCREMCPPKCRLSRGPASVRPRSVNNEKA